MLFNCKECGQPFESQRSLHAHIKKHDMFLGDYYVKYYPKFNKLTGEPIQFKNFDDYFSRDFANKDQMVQWLNQAPEEEAKDYLLHKLSRRIIDKGLRFAPSTTDLFTSELPPMKFYKKFFPSYKKACQFCGSEPMFGKSLPECFKNPIDNVKIFIDTREQKPLVFKNSEKLKLDVGDYAVGGEDYKYTYVDRKSFGDFCLTLTQGQERFERELERCKELGCYLFIVIESDLYQMEKQNLAEGKRHNLTYVFHVMREIQHKYFDCCQFVFSGNREKSQALIPKLLVLGESLWQVDMQYFIDEGVLN